MRPTAIQLDRQKQLLIVAWDDDRTTALPLSVLREACPCVECRGGHENMGQLPKLDDLNLTAIPLTRTKSYNVTGIAPVGNYAIQPEWTDGHHTGIYTWPYLRQLADHLDQSGPPPAGPRYEPVE